MAAGYMAAAVFAALFAVCFTICVCVAWKSVKLAINVVDASADFIMSTKRILFVPLVYFFLMLFVTIIWFCGYMCIMSLNPMHPSTLIPQLKSVEW